MHKVCVLLYWQCSSFRKEVRKDGRHVIESGKVILANNFNNCLNNFLSIVDKESNPPKIYLAHH